MDVPALIDAIGPSDVRGSIDVTVTSLTYDAESAEPGSLHFCVPGFRVDGHDFAG
ncbi:MAG: hypothetical protein QOH74_675, partial [Gaiellales bacterium]|nr:hypothetical protein [Gaiellales bacterium]